MKNVEVFINKKKKRNNNMVVKYTKIYQKKKNKSLLSIEKDVTRL